MIFDFLQFFLLCHILHEINMELFKDYILNGITYHTSKLFILCHTFFTVNVKAD